MHDPISLDIRSLTAAYREERLQPRDVAQLILERSRARADDAIWIAPPDEGGLNAELRRLEAQFADAGARPPLYGIPLALKDNIDARGWPTTAGCPEFAYRPERDATVVQRLRDAGAMVVGKTNMDQFATGLVGARSPHGPARNPFDARYVPGGSSSGSAVAVATGLCSFALGTDTAGSGRVPAAFNNIVGLKPSRGLLSNRGTVPACRSLDCVSVFALTCDDALRVLSSAAGVDVEDPFSKPVAAANGWPDSGFRFGVPREDELEFHGDRDAEALFRASVDALIALGGRPASVSIAPMLEAARLLYEGPWLAERVAALGAFWRERGDAIHPVVREVIERGERYGAVEAFEALYRLRELESAMRPMWASVDCLVTPTTPTIHSLAEDLADPVRLNARLGRYTNFVNLMDLCALAVPAGFRGDGLALGVTLMAPPGSEAALARTGDWLHRARVTSLGATGIPLPEPTEAPAPAAGAVELAVVGAHLEGEPLHGELLRHGAVLQARTRTAPGYRLYALADTRPEKPGLARDPAVASDVEVEVYALGMEAFGHFTAGVPAPLGIGSVHLRNGRSVKGFVCEPYALAGATDITRFGGWRAYRAAARTLNPTSEV